MKRRKFSGISLALLLAAGLVLGGCSSRADVENAYSLYEATSSYASVAGVTVSAGAELDLFAASLCVGGTTNTQTELTAASYAATAAVFVLTDTDVAYAQNIYEKRYPASTTKILTAYVALKYGDLDQQLTVSESALADLDPASSVCGLNAGDQLTLRQALYGLMLCSGNDAANVIAESIAGSVEDFAALMNQEAAALGATNSHFVNPHGLPDEDHYTTAYDLYLIFSAAIADEDFLEIISTTSYVAAYTDGDGAKVTQTWNNTNGYLSGTYEMPEGITVIGGKTGTTNAAGYCLVLYSENSAAEPVISIVMKGNTRSDMYSLMTQILANYGN